MHQSILLAACLSTPILAAPQSIAISNPSFEEGSPTPNAWSIPSAGAETIKAASTPTIVTTQDGLSFLRFGHDNQPGAIEQTLLAPIASGEYCLSFLINRVFNDSKSTRPIKVEFFAGDSLLATSTIASDSIPNENSLSVRKSVTCYVPAQSPAIGKPLRIRISGENTQGFAMTAIDSLALTHDSAVTATKTNSNPYSLSAKDAEFRNTSPLPNMGGTAKDGTKYEVTGEQWLRNGKPWYPISGEFHYARYPEQDWARELGKMKALGCDIVATYVFWNQHETAKGQWNWENHLNFRKFVQTAQEQGLLVWLRFGPYINAEARNGGIPEFANKGKRSNSPDYLPHVEAYFKELSKQVHGLFVQDGGPIVGIQLDNEFAAGKAEHLTKLKELSIAAGMTAPYWSVTANSRFDRFTAIPLQGSYTYRGWEGGGGTKPTSGFSFSTDEWTANTDLGGTFYDTKDYPRGFCELGTGSPMKSGCRFLVEPEFVLAQAYDCVGRGTNYLGYYMFHGGVQQEGTNGGGWPLCYDFQAPLGEYGQIRDSGRQYRKLHTFIKEFTPELTPARTIRDPKASTDPSQTERLRHVARLHNDRGFWFVNNTQRNKPLPTRNDVQTSLTLNSGETMTIPASPLTMPDRSFAVFPVNLELAPSITLSWATAQPLARIQNPKLDIPTTVLFWPSWSNGELAVPKTLTITQESGKFTSTTKNSSQILTSTSVNERSSLILSNGKTKHRLLFITQPDSDRATIVTNQGSKHLLISPNADVSHLDPVKIQAPAEASVTIEAFPPITTASSWKTKTKSNWSSSTLAPSPAIPAPKLTQEGTDGTVWKISAEPAKWTTLSHAYLQLPYSGNEAALMVNGKTITQDYFHKDSWTIDLRRHADAITHGTLTLKITGNNANTGDSKWIPTTETLLFK